MNSDEFKSAVGGNKLGQSLIKNRMYEKSLERKIEEIEKLCVKRERKLDSKKIEFEYSQSSRSTRRVVNMVNMGPTSRPPAPVAPSSAPVQPPPPPIAPKAPFRREARSHHPSPHQQQNQQQQQQPHQPNFQPNPKPTHHLGSSSGAHSQSMSKISDNHLATTSNNPSTNGKFSSNSIIPPPPVLSTSNHHHNQQLPPQPQPQPPPPPNNIRRPNGITSSLSSIYHSNCRSSSNSNNNSAKTMPTNSRLNNITATNNNISHNHQALNTQNNKMIGMNSNVSTTTTTTTTATKTSQQQFNGRSNSHPTVMPIDENQVVVHVPKRPSTNYALPRATANNNRPMMTQAASIPNQPNVNHHATSHPASSDPIAGPTNSNNNHSGSHLENRINSRNSVITNTTNTTISNNNNNNKQVVGTCGGNSSRSNLNSYRSDRDVKFGGSGSVAASNEQALDGNEPIDHVISDNKTIENNNSSSSRDLMSSSGTSRGSYVALFHKNKLEAKLKRMKIKPIKLDDTETDRPASIQQQTSPPLMAQPQMQPQQPPPLPPLELAEPQAPPPTSHTCTSQADAFAAGTTSTSSGLIGVSSSSSKDLQHHQQQQPQPQQITTKVSTVEKNCLNITKVECIPKKTYQEQNLSVVNTIRIAKSIYEFSSSVEETVHEQQKHQQMTSTSELTSSTTREFLIKSSEFEGLEAAVAAAASAGVHTSGGMNLTSNRHRHGIKHAQTGAAGAAARSSKNRGDSRLDEERSSSSMKSKSLNEFSTTNTSSSSSSSSSSSTKTSTTSLHPLADQRFIDLISLLAIDNN